MTTKEIRETLGKGEFNAKTLEAMKEALGKWFKSKYNTEAFVRTETGWNSRIERIGIYDCGVAKGDVYAYVYWQGDSTDGHDCIPLKYLLAKDEYMIAADDRHSVIRVKRSDVVDAVKAFTKEITPTAIKKRNEENKISDYLRDVQRIGNKYYDEYGWQREKYINGKYGALAYFRKNWKELSAKTDKEQNDIYYKVFKLNFCKNERDFKTDERGEKIYFEI